MKLLNKFLIPAVLFFSAVSCSDDYLETEPTSILTETQISNIAQVDPTIGDATLNGVYAYFAQAGTGGSSDQEDFGQKSYDIMLDLLSQDMAQKSDAYARHNQLSRLVALQDESNRYNYRAWRHYFRIVFGANSLIDQYGGTDVVPEAEEAKYIYGQAKVLRAFAYYYIVNLFSTEYTPDELVAPIYKSVTAGEGLSSQADIYAFIEADLTQGIELLETYDRGGSKLNVNKYLAKAILANVYAAQGKNAQALPLCEDVIKNGGFVLAQGDQLTNGFNNVNQSNVMWGTEIIDTQGFILNSWWGFMDVFSFSYAWAGNQKVIDEDLYNSMDESDKRRAQFVSSAFDFSNSNASLSSHYLLPGGKFYDVDQIVGGPTTPRTGDYIYMRIAEVYLLGAETAAKSNNDAKARELLKAVVSLRVDDANYIDGLSGQALIDEISKQTRLELWGEGKSYFLMKRNKETRTRSSIHKYLAGESFVYNDPRMTFQLPLAEKQNNPFID